MKLLFVFSCLLLCTAAGYLFYGEYQRRAESQTVERRSVCLQTARDYFSEYWGPDSNEPPYHRQRRETMASCLAERSITTQETASIRHEFQSVLAFANRR